MSLEPVGFNTALGAHTIGWDPSTGQLHVFGTQSGGALVFRETDVPLPADARRGT